MLTSSKYYARKALAKTEGGALGQEEELCTLSQGPQKTQWSIRRWVSISGTCTLSQISLVINQLNVSPSINGCSLKTPENLKAAAVVRPENLLLETGDWITTCRGFDSFAYGASPQTLLGAL